MFNPHEADEFMIELLGTTGAGGWLTRVPKKKKLNDRRRGMADLSARTRMSGE